MHRCVAVGLAVVMVAEPGKARRLQDHQRTGQGAALSHCGVGKDAGKGVRRRVRADRVAVHYPWACWWADRAVSAACAEAPPVLSCFTRSPSSACRQTDTGRGWTIAA